MQCLADFTLDSDLCLALDVSPLTLRGPDGAFSCTISNAGKSPEAPDAVLSAQLIFQAESFDNTLRDVAYDKLAEILNCLLLRQTEVRRQKAEASDRLDTGPGRTRRDHLSRHPRMG